MSALRRHRGFTLLEVMIVVAIVGIMGTLAYSGFQTARNNARISGEAETLALFLRLGKLRTISTGCSHVVRYRGPNYTNVPVERRGILELIRKANCTMNTVGDTAQVAGDRVVNEYRVAATVPVVDNLGATLQARSLHFGFTPTGGFFSGDEATLGVVTGPGASALQFGTVGKFIRGLAVSGAGYVKLQ
jgi:prepilin-type N-terminal cleavage/methylation domain-containing protein